MFRKRRLAAFAPVIAALAVAAPVASGNAATSPVTEPILMSGSPSCPPWYNGPTNLATGCPFWLMIYSADTPR
jgi:hypothetical protein